MNPGKVVRANVRKLTDLPNVGPAMARDFESLGFRAPAQLKGRDRPNRASIAMIPEIPRIPAS